MLSWIAITTMGLGDKVRFWCGDETRIGLKTMTGRKITARGVKPKGKVQWKFQATYIYGIVEPKTGGKDSGGGLDKETKRDNLESR
jgi:hypothetical protein